MTSPGLEKPRLLGPGDTRPGDLYRAAEDTLGTIYKEASRRQPFAITPVAEMAERLAEAAAREDIHRPFEESIQRYGTLMQQTMGSNPAESHLVRHPLNVTIYALKLASALDYPLIKLQELALAGMLYDIGLTAVPEAVLSKSGPLSEYERSLIKRHPINSFETLQGLGPNWQWLADVALQHHEREDGTGYPHGLKGDQIHEYAKIIRICEIYEAMVHGRPYRREVAPFAAVSEIVQRERGVSSQEILRAFINGISPYPVGSWVCLSSKETGRVIATNKTTPLRPVLEVLYDASGEKLPQPKLIDLSKDTLLHITSCAIENEGS
jgi:HD-GYP domain-containing protein (c-di-GMP phosphodiesterase class II)